MGRDQETRCEVEVDQDGRMETRYWERSRSGW